jgi:eukaryotic-like serine/threonine-protein kinase
MPPRHLERSLAVPPDALLTKLPGAARRSSLSRDGALVADNLERQAVRRLRLVAWITFAALLIMWLVVNLIQGTFAREFASPLQWGFPVAILVASLAVALLTRGTRLPVSTLIRIGLIYQVVFSFGLAGGLYMGAFEGEAPDAITFERTGVTFVGLWMMLFAVLVPAAPGEALLALVGSASAVPLIYLAQVPSRLAPPLPAPTFALIFVLPYLVIVGLAYAATSIINHLGAEVRRAYELGSYRLEARLGRGGMGEVWRASHRMLARPAAIKLIRPEALDGDPDTASARFEREAQAIASLQSPNTIALYDFGSTEEGTLYYVMELLDGVNLEDLIREHGPLCAERVVHIARQVCGSLAEAHARAIIHRDIKPANIYLCRRALDHDVVKVLDFGLVRRVISDASGAWASVTQADLIAGTPAYLAPEITMGGVVDGRADLYALGCVAFWLLTGRLVFPADTVTAMLVAHAQTPPPRPSRFAPLPLPEALDQLVVDCLAKDPEGRPPTADAIAERLAAIGFDHPWTPAAAARWWAINRPTPPTSDTA